MKKKIKAHELSDSEIETQLEDSYKQLREKRFEVVVNRALENTKILRDLRKKIALLQTVKNERKKANK
ncbi:MAG: 50S ribosomal protein L29 [Leptospiraceae bacterium]|nr:50S ribosomal protein L29 [Leptospiraceae bacterium]MCP5501967.1 50S ribosomal protein L29 [Leptospiraceae bacterium]